MLLALSAGNSFQKPLCYPLAEGARFGLKWTEGRRPPNEVQRRRISSNTPMIISRSGQNLPQ